MTKLQKLPGSETVNVSYTQAKLASSKFKLYPVGTKALADKLVLELIKELELI